jgi:ABC-type molybdate transport system substrate-binding protein
MRTLAILMAAFCLAAGAPASAAEDFFAALHHDADNDAAARGLEFTEPGIDDLADFHGDLTAPKLALYVGGNYFFAMGPLVQAFEAAYPAYKGRIYWETLPPGLLAQQIADGGTVTTGNMTWTVKADIYLAGQAQVKTMVAQGVLVAPATAYVTNTLTIMVPKGNPAHVTGLADLGRADIRLVMPNPAFEGIAQQIKAALAKAGGDALVAAVYERKVADGSTILTHIHHRQTPMILLQGRADAGVTWQSEAMYQEQAGHAIAHVDIPAAENAVGVYAGAAVAGAPHPDAARDWLAFLRTPAARAIFEGYGFKPYDGDGK